MVIVKRQPKDLATGTVHKTNSCGDVEVIDYLGTKRVLVRFKDTGNMVEVAAGDLRRGEVNDKYKPSFLGKGFIGKGSYKSTVKNKKTKCYVTWTNMLTRCYDEKYHEGKPTYTHCTVTPDWLNYQNFAEWYYETYPCDGKRYSLDKDYKVAGNKVYSPDTCTWLTVEKNSMITSGTENTSWVFVNKRTAERRCVYNLTSFSKEIGISNSVLYKVVKHKRDPHVVGWVFEGVVIGCGDYEK